MKLICTQCGADGEMQCECGVGFIALANATPKAEQVAAAIAEPANVNKSDRKLAEELGVGHATVSRARQKSVRAAPPTVSNETVAKRVGKDGKARKQPKPKPELRVVPRVDFGALDIGTERIGKGLKAQPVQLMPANIQKIRDSAMRVADIAAQVERLSKIDAEMFEDDVAKMLTHARGGHSADRDFAKDARKALEAIEANLETAVAALAKLRELVKGKDDAA